MGLFQSCTEDEFDGEGQPDTDPVTIILSTLTGTSGDIDMTAPDHVISSFRIMAFHSTGGMLALNKCYDFSSTFENPINFEILPDTYDFIFIANETSDPALSPELDNTTSLTHLEGLFFTSPAFHESKPIPMSAAYYGVVVNATKGISLDNELTFIKADQTIPWTIILERMGVRVDIILQTAVNALRTEFNNLEFKNIPDKVYVFKKKKDGTFLYNNGSYEPSSRTYTKSSGDTGYTAGFQYNPTDAVYEWKKTRLILPASEFPDKNTSGDGVQIVANYQSMTSQTAVLSSIASNDYTLPRNYHIEMTGILDLNLNMELRVMDWMSGFNDNYEPGKVYTLSTSVMHLDLGNNPFQESVTITTTYPGGWTAVISSSWSGYQAPTNNHNWLQLSQTSGPPGSSTILFSNITSPGGSLKNSCYVLITAGNMTTVIIVNPSGTT